jgi:hypothetical protein
MTTDHRDEDGMAQRDGVPAPRGRDVRGIALVVAVTLLAAGVAALSIVVPPAQVALPPVSARTPDAGGSVCAAGGVGASTGDALVLAAVPISARTAVASTAADGEGDDRIAPTSRATVVALGATTRRLPIEPLGSSELLRLDPSLGSDEWLWTGWADHPTVAWREWTSEGGPGLPRGRAAAPCVPTYAATSVIPGLRTDGGNEAFVTIANPFTADATFAVTLVTPAGRTEPIALRNMSVSGGERVQLRVNDHLPREADVAVIVEVGAGRLAVEGHQLALAGIGGVDGLTFAPASIVASTTWTVPWLVADPELDTWLWVLNPEPRSVTLDLVIHTAQGSSLPEGLETVTLAPSGLVRIPAADLAPRAGGPFGVTLRSGTTGVHVAVGLQASADAVERTGIATSLGSPAADGLWVIAGTGVAERATELHVVNLGSEDAAVAFTLRLRPEDAAASGTRPLRGVVVPPGAVTRVPLPLDDAGAWSVEVSGPPHLVVSRTAFGATLLEPLVGPAVPSASWLRPVTPLAGHALEGWARSLGTDADLRRGAQVFADLPAVSPEDGG